MRVTTQAGNAPTRQPSDVNTWHSAMAGIGRPTLICLPGNFSLRKLGHPVKVFNGREAEALLCLLALHSGYLLAREALLNILWPQTNLVLATQSLNSLVYNLHTDGCYQINVQAGVGVDVTRFDVLADAGDQQDRPGNQEAATTTYGHALQLYRGDLCTSAELSL